MFCMIQSMPVTSKSACGCHRGMRIVPMVRTANTTKPTPACFRVRSLHCITSFSQCSILEHAKSITHLIANVLCHDAVQVVFPCRVLIYELIGGGLVALILNVKDSLQQL